MSVVAAAGWGAVSAGAVLLGQALAPSLRGRNQAVGLLMGFGAGTLVSAIAYELIPESTLDAGPWVAVTFVAGALTSFLADLAVDELVEMTGIDDEAAKALIMKAREHWFTV